MSVEGIPLATFRRKKKHHQRSASQTPLVVDKETSSHDEIETLKDASPSVRPNSSCNSHQPSPDQRYGSVVAAPVADKLSSESRTTPTHAQDHRSPNPNHHRAQHGHSWRRLTRHLKQAKSGAQSGYPDRSDEYDFFATVFWPDTGPVLPETRKTDSGEASETGAENEMPSEEEVNELGQKKSSSQQQEEDEDGRLLLCDFAPEEMDHWQLVENQWATYVGHELRRLETEGQLLYVPSLAPAPLSRKLPDDFTPWFPEDEGLYVGSKPWVAPRNINRLEHRLLAEGSTNWFGEDGQVIALPNPLRSQPLRPVLFETELPPALQTEFKHARLSGIGSTEPVLMDAAYPLELDLTELVFHHHALFAEEHVLAQQLMQLYETYAQRARRDVTNRCTQKLRALYAATETLENAMTACPDDSLSKQRVEKNRHQIALLRQERDAQGAKDRILLRNILTVWKALKDTRKSGHGPCTDVQLVIHKEEPDYAQDTAQWEEDIERELTDNQRDYAHQFEKEQADYEKRLQDWKTLIQHKRAERKLKKKERRASQAEDESEDERLPPKPVPPEQDYNEAEMRETIIENALRCRRPPGEPIIFLELKHKNLEEKTSSDNARAIAVSRLQYSISVLYNGKEAACTSFHPLSPTFRASIQQAFSLWVRQPPHSLSLQVWEKEVGSWSKCQLLAKIPLPIPDNKTTLKHAADRSYHFMTNLVIPASKGGMGSGITYTGGAGVVASPLFTNGVVKCRVGWGYDSQGIAKCPPESVWSPAKMELTGFLAGEDNLANSGQLQTLLDETQLDVNDPANVHLLEALQEFENRAGNGDDEFRLEALTQPFDFCSQEEIDADLRLQILRQRFLGDPEYRDMTMVPIKAQEIPRDVLKVCEKRKQDREWKLTASTEHYNLRNPIDKCRADGKKKLAMIRQKIAALYQEACHKRVLSDIVIEDQVPDIGTLGLTLMSIFSPKRPLRPERQERKGLQGGLSLGLGGQSVNILVHVVQAFHVPNRKDTEPRKTTKNDDFQEVGVRPFVEITFQRSVARTTTAVGPSPTWNQELKLPFIPLNGDLTPSGLSVVSDVLYIQLFDEVVVDVLQDQRDRETHVHQRFDRHWLGGIQIPFSTIYQQNRIDGTFRLKTAPVLFGYENNSMQDSPNRYFSSSTDGPVTSIGPYITLFITLQPPLNLPELNKPHFESMEEEWVVNGIQEFVSNGARDFPQRMVNPLVVGLDGKQTYVGRFLKPIAPPADLLDDNPSIAMGKLARFVSAIPCIADSRVFMGPLDIWAHSEQFLEMLCGDEEEHAILLANFFLAMNWKCYLVLGLGLPEGNTAYVLVHLQVRDEWWLFNAVTGQRLAINDSLCPLQKVFALVSPENFWLNVQLQVHPGLLRFDVNRATDWRPLFGRHLIKPSMGVTTTAVELSYETAQAKWVQELQERLERKLKDAFMSWRKNRRTRWNRHCGTLLRKFLPRLEQSRFEGTAIGEDLVQELAAQLSPYEVWGFPMETGVTDVEFMGDMLYSTGLHRHSDPSVEFALAVYVHPYPSLAVYVWFYVAALVKKDTN